MPICLDTKKLFLGHIIAQIGGVPDGMYKGGISLIDAYSNNTRHSMHLCRTGAKEETEFSKPKRFFKNNLRFLGYLTAKFKPWCHL